MLETRPKVIISKIGLDGHDKGTRAICAALRDAGAEVVYLGLYRTPQQIVASAIEEDADLIGVSTHCGEHLTLVPKLLDLLKEKGVDVPVVVGGIFAKEDILTLKKSGVSEVFVGSTTDVFINWLKNHIVPKIDPAGQG